MRLRPDTLALTALLALLQSTGPLSTDIYLPSLPSIADAFETSPANVQLTLSVFLAGFAVGQIFYGPVSDRIGRRPTLLAGLGLFVLGSFLCAVAASVEMLIAARFLQAIGGAGPVVLARAIVRDLYEGERAGTELARMGSIMGLVPMLGPVVGSLLEIAFGWRSAFWFILLIGLGSATAVLFLLPETVRERSRMPLSPIGIARSFRPLLAVGSFRANTAIVCLTYSGLFCYISGSSFVLQGVYGFSPVAFGVAFGAGAAAYVAGTLIGQATTPRIGLEGSYRIGAGLLALSALGLVVGQLAGPGHGLEFVLPQLLYFVGVGLALPAAMASALTPFPGRSGAASSLMGFLQMTTAALLGGLLGAVLGDTAWPTVLFIAGCGLGVFVLFATTTRIRAATAEGERGSGRAAGA